MAQPHSPSRAVSVTVRVGLRKLLGVDIHGDGESNLPEPGTGFIVAHNLVSPLDAFVMALALADAGHHDPIVMLRGSIRGVPFLGPLLAAGALTFGEPNTDDVFTFATDALFDGRVIVTPPEAVVSRSLEIGNLRSDPIRLATATDKPLVPGAVFGAHRLFDASGRLRPKRGVPVGVTIGAPVPIDGSLNFAPQLRLLRLDMEALLSMTLDHYPDKEYGEGRSWWPASRYGGAPTVFEAMQDPLQVSSPSAELWADDTRVVATRVQHGVPAAQGPAEEPDVPRLVLEDGPLGEGLWIEVTDDAELEGRATVDPSTAVAASSSAPSDDGTDLPPMASRDVPILSHPTRTSRPDVAPGLEQESTLDPTLDPTLEPTLAVTWDRDVTTSAFEEDSEPSFAVGATAAPSADPDLSADDESSDDAGASEPRAAAAPASRVAGITGLLAFDMPGNPRILLRDVVVGVDDGDLVLTLPASTVCLQNVELDRADQHSFFWGRLAEDHVAADGAMRMTVPAGTRATFVAARPR